MENSENNADSRINLEKGHPMRHLIAVAIVALLGSIPVFPIRAEETLWKSDTVLATVSPVQELYDRALTAQEGGNLEEATGLLDQVIALQPDHALAHWLRGAILLQQERLDAAITDLKESTRLAPEFAEGHAALGWGLLLAGRFAEAMEPTRKAHESAPENFSWTVNLGHLHLFANDPGKARVLYESSLPTIPDDEAYRIGPQADFALFLKKGWAVAAVRTEAEWFDAAWEQEKSRRRDRIEAETLNQKIIDLSHAGQFSAALPLARRALEIRENTLGPDHPDTIVSLNNLAMLHKEMGNHAAAIPLARRILTIRENTLGPDHPDTARSLNNLASLNKNIGAFSEAESSYKRALTIRENTLGPDHPDTATSLNNLAMLYREMGNPIAALPLAQRAMTIWEKSLGPDHPQTATGLNNLALLYQDMGDQDEAQSCYKRALAIREKSLGPDHPDTATSFNNLAMLYKNIGSYSAAESLLRQALAVKEKSLGTDHPRTATTLDNLAVLYHDMGAYAEAESRYRHALAIREKSLGPDHPDTAISLVNLGTLYQDMGNHDKAESRFKEALAIQEKILGAKHPDTAASLNNLAVLYQDMGAHARAKPLYRRALAIREQTLGPDHPDTVWSLNNLALLYQAMGAHDKAEPLHGRALALAINAQNPELQWRVEYSMSQLFEKLGDPGSAIFFGKRAVNIVQKLRGGISGMEKDLQRTFLTDKKGVYEGLAHRLIDQGRLMEAERVLAMLKEEEYFDYIRRDLGKDPRNSVIPFALFEQPLEEGLTERLRRLGVLGKKRVPLARLKVRTPEQERQLLALDAVIANAVEDFQHHLVEIREAFRKAGDKAHAVAFNETDRTDLGRLQNALEKMGHSVVVLNYLPGTDRLRILVITPETIVTRSAPVTLADLAERVIQSRKLFADPENDPKPMAKEWYDLLIGPVAADLPVNATLMVSLTGSLRYLPLAALHDGERWLIEKHPVTLFTVAGGASGWQSPSGMWRVAGFGVSTGGGEHLVPLPAVRDELDAIILEGAGDTRGVLPGKVHLDEAFDDTTLKKTMALAKSQVFHIASHFDFRPGTEMDSFLLLGGGKRLTLAEFKRGKDRFHDVDLLTLSACETAVGGTDAQGREVEGFGALAQHKGAAAVLATLWPVDDASTGRFMADFYRRREVERLTKAEALQRTMTAFIRGEGNKSDDSRTTPVSMDAPLRRDPSPDPSHAHPYYWAPFILMGNWL
ncbi:MAG: tetratricopeptide repeat protein [Magnetococcales bacterium]|nr:tetratricopeptide repeat protein [Magnetococcales bacterium]